MTNPGQYDRETFNSIVAAQEYDPQELTDRLCLAYAQFDEVAHWVNPHLPHTDHEMITFSDDRRMHGFETLHQTVVALHEARNVRVNFPRTGRYSVFLASLDFDPQSNGRHLDRTIEPLIVATTLEEFTALAQARRARLTIARFPK